MEFRFSHTEISISLAILVWGALPLVLYAVHLRRERLRGSKLDCKVPLKLIIFHVLSYLSLALLFGIKSVKEWVEDDGEDGSTGKRKYQMYLACDVVAFFLFYVLYVGSFFLTDSFVIDRRVMGLDKLGEYFQMLRESIPTSCIEVTCRDANMCIIRSSKVRVKMPHVTDRTQPLSVVDKVLSGSFRLKLSLDVQWSGNAKIGLDNAKRMLIERESAKGGSVSAELVSSMNDMCEEILVVKPGKGVPWCSSPGAAVVSGFLLFGLNFVVFLNSKVPVIYHAIIKEVSADGQEHLQTESKKTV